MAPKKTSTTMTSSMSRDDGYVSMPSSQDGGDSEKIPLSVRRQEFLHRRWNVTPSEDSNCYERSLSVGRGQDRGHCQGQTIGQGHSQSPGQVEKPLASILNSLSVKTTTSAKPQKPVKPANLLSLMRSRDTTGNGVTLSQSGSSSRSRGSPDVATSPAQCVNLPSSSTAQPSHINDTSQQTRDDVETTRGQNSLHSDAKLLTQRTTTSTEPVMQSSTISLTSPRSTVCVDTISGQVSPRSEDEQLARWTTVSPEHSHRSSDDDLHSEPSDVGVKSVCRQSSLQSGDNQPREWTTPSTEHILQSSHGYLSSEHSADGVDIACRQDSPLCADDQLTQWTRSSTSSVSQSSQPSDFSTETTCRQSSPRCNKEQQTQCTETSLQAPQVSVDAERPISDTTSLSSNEHIEPPIIYDLLPDNVHIRRGGTLQLLAQFTAFPPPEVSWYRANDLLTPGQRIIIIIIFFYYYCFI